VNSEDTNGYFDKINESTKEIILPIGHFTIINSNFEKISPLPTIAVYGLGSCIGLIIYDTVNRIAGMSHILLPKSSLEGPLKYPHKYADTSVCCLIESMIEHGADSSNLKVSLVGGANIFQNPDCTIGEDNIKSIKEVLMNFNLLIERENLGGNKGRIVRFDTNDYSIRVKITGEQKFKLI
jgi:chemotaxis protein CheD